MSLLRINEIFYSIQGESTRVGLPTVFIRLTGCPLRCTYCDTEYAFSGGFKLSISEIINKISQYKSKYVTLTGGEPLSQPASLELITDMINKGYFVSIETSGAIDISNVDNRAMLVMDLKTPASTEDHRNLYSNIEFLKATDQVKFVICDKLDYDWSLNIIKEFELSSKCEILFSPSYGQVHLSDLAEWMLADKLSNIRLQTQLHKHIWGEQQGK